MRYEDLNALVMQVRPYRESSALVTVLSREAGRFTMVVRGVRNKKRGVLVQPFVLARISCVGKSTLLTNTKYEVLERIDLNGNQLSAGFYVLEILRRAMAEYQTEEEVFDLAISCLTQLQGIERADARHIGQCLRPFEFRLMFCLGYGVDLSADALSGKRVVPDKYYRLEEEVGVVENGDDAEGYSGRVLLEIAAGDFSRNETLSAARKMTSQMLPALIGHEPLVSRTLWST